MAENHNEKEMKKVLTKLMNVSEKAIQENVKHLLIVVDDKEEASYSGSAGLCEGLVRNQNLNSLFKDNLKENVSPGVDQYCRSVTLPRLPCSPSSRQWKGSRMIRKSLADALSASGYGNSGTLILKILFVCLFVCVWVFRVFGTDLSFCLN